MQEIFYEESVALHDEKPAKRRYTLFTVTAVLCIVFAVISFFYSDDGNSGGGTVYSVLYHMGNNVCGDGRLRSISLYKKALFLSELRLYVCFGRIADLQSSA